MGVVACLSAVCRWPLAEEELDGSVRLVVCFVTSWGHFIYHTQQPWYVRAPYAASLTVAIAKKIDSIGDGKSTSKMDCTIAATTTTITTAFHKCSASSPLSFCIHLIFS